MTNQLKTWIISDYERIINSIASLKEKQWQLDMATAEAEKGGPKYIYLFTFFKRNDWKGIPLSNFICLFSKDEREFLRSP